MNITIKKKLIIALLALLILIGNLQYSNASKISMAYLYGNYDYIYLMERVDNSVNVVSPSSFDLDSNGNLELNYINSEFINKMHQKKIKITPFLSNHWDKEKGRKALANMEKLSTDIANVIEKYNLDGINVDIENVTETDREKYVNFIRLLREKIPVEKMVSVAVAANPYNLKTGWHGSYDYENLAKYADYLMVMAYDEHYESGAEGAVAGIDFVEETIKYALTKVVGEKIVIGIPFYGRYWKSGNSYGGYGVTLDKIKKLLNEYESVVVYNDEEQYVKATIKIKAGDIKPSINGRTLYEGTYNFYYENEESMRAKINLIQQYDLKGIGCWSLGQETDTVWENYANYLEDKQVEFSDISNVKWAKEAIEFVKQRGWIAGRTMNRYEPEAYLTRAEFVTIIARILELDVLYTNDTLYTDVNRHWAKNSINALTKTGIIEGYENKTFKPDNYITREETAKILCTIKDVENARTNIKFADVSPNSWAYEYIIKLADAGIIKGYEDSTYRPLNNITRAEIAVILERMYN